MKVGRTDGKAAFPAKIIHIGKRVRAAEVSKQNWIFSNKLHPTLSTAVCYCSVVE